MFRTFTKRTGVTLVNAVSKLFPGGFGWQGATEFVQRYGYQSTDLSFSFAAGIGDALGVGLGNLGCHMLVKYPIVMFSNRYCGTHWLKPTLQQEMANSLLLGSASFCSGTAWQPILDGFKAMELGFPASMVGTGIICGTLFFAGLRISRYLYPTIFGCHAIEKANQANRIQDAVLSMGGIAGASGTFVATDVSFGDENPLREVFGADKAPLHNMFRAGLSTMTGFTVIQTLQNFWLSKTLQGRENSISDAQEIPMRRLYKQ